MISDEMKTMVQQIEHQALVRLALFKLANQLMERAMAHDLSKWREDEFGGFVDLTRISRVHPLGSPEYEASWKENKAIDLHFERNTHHPDHWPDGINDMNLLDIIEMVIDWEAVNEVKQRTASTCVSWDDSIEYHTKRFGLSEEQLRLIRLIVELL